MKSALLMLFLLPLLNAVQPPLSSALISSGLTFQNVTGRGVTKEQVDSFIKFANYASTVYGEDIEKTTKFIKSRMDELYGLSNDNFYIFVQTDQAQTSRYFWVPVESVYAGLSGTNPLYPSWSYIFLRGYGSKNIADYSFISNGKKGKGISSQLEKTIRDLVFAYETGDSCVCTKDLTAQISDGVRAVESNAWTVICDDKGVTSALILTFDERFLSIKPKNCFYTMFMYV